MNNKKILVFSFVSLILFGLILNFVYAGILSSATADVSTFSAYTVSNWTKGGENTSVSFTLNFTSGEYDTISNITLFTPGNILLTNYLVAANKTNITISDGALLDSWSCEHNSTLYDSLDFIDGITCQNETATSSLNTSLNGSVIINLEVYYNATGTEEAVNWRFEVSNSSGGVGTDSVVVSTNIDDLAPRLNELNISDGYTTLGNGSNGQFSLNVLGVLLNEKDMVNNGTLRGDGSLTVSATLEDSGANAQTMLTSNSVYLYYNTTEGNASAGGLVDTPIRMTTSDSITPYQFTGVITGLSENNVATLVLVVNDTFNNVRYVNDTDAGVTEPFAVLTNTTNVPVLSLLNISDGDYNISVLSGGYLRPGTQTFTINAAGRDLFGINEERDLSTGSAIVRLYYNTTGNLTTDVNGYVQSADASEAILLTNNTESSYSAVYSGSASIVTGNDTNTLSYAIVANTTSNGSATYYTLLTGQYKIDNSGPTSTTLTSDDSDNRISTGNSITFTCGDATDAGVGVNSNLYTWKVTRGGDNEETVAGQTTGTLTLSSTSSPNTNKIDTYTIKCIPYDLLGHAGTEKSTTITVSSSGGTSASSAGGGSSSVTPSFDVDLSTSTTGSISGSVGRIRSFSFDGSTKHTVTFKEITVTSAKITIASTPIEVILNIGETKKVDINSDGTDDLEVALDNIKFGTNAEITIKKLETGAKKVVEEEKSVAKTETTGEAGITEEATKGTGWLWVTILIIIVLVTVGYYVFKKK